MGPFDVFCVVRLFNAFYGLISIKEHNNFKKYKNALCQINMLEKHKKWNTLLMNMIHLWVL
jgi:hypothetical protein